MIGKLARGSRPMMLAPLLALVALVVTSAHGQITDATRRAARAAVPPSTTTMPAAAAPVSSGSGVIRMEKAFDGPELSVAPAKLPIAPAEVPAATPQSAQRLGDLTFVPAPPRPSFILQQDKPIHTELQAWATGQDWQLVWYPSVSWRVLRQADLSRAADVTAAVSEVIDILRDEGKPLRLKISDGNRVMEVFSNEVRND